MYFDTRVAKSAQKYVQGKLGGKWSRKVHFLRGLPAWTVRFSGKKSFKKSAQKIFLKNVKKSVKRSFSKMACYLIKDFFHLQWLGWAKFNFWNHSYIVPKNLLLFYIKFFYNVNLRILKISTSGNTWFWKTIPLFYGFLFSSWKIALNKYLIIAPVLLFIRTYHKYFINQQ